MQAFLLQACARQPGRRFFAFMGDFERKLLNQKLKYDLCSTVTYTESGTPMLNWDSRYLCHFSTEMAEIWSPGTSFQDVWTCKISALYLLYFHSYETFSGNH